MIDCVTITVTLETISAVPHTQYLVRDRLSMSLQDTSGRLYVYFFT